MELIHVCLNEIDNSPKDSEFLSGVSMAYMEIYMDYVNKLGCF